MDGTEDSARAKRTVRVHYEEMAAKYAGQFVVNRSEDGIVIGFSSGLIEDPASEQLLLPVHSRVAMSISGAKKLMAVLENATSETPAGNESSTEAQLPRIEQ